MLKRIGAGVLAGIVAFGVALHLTEPEPSSTVKARLSDSELVRDQRRPSTMPEGAPHSRVSSAPLSIRTEPSDDGLSADDARALELLRNRVLDETGRDMQRRGVSVMDCLKEVDLAGDLKIRFSISVKASPAEATLGQWRFVEVVDGQMLPEAFAPCAASAMGSGLRLVAEPNAQFLQFDDEIDTVYRIFIQ